MRIAKFVQLICLIPAAYAAATLSACTSTPSSPTTTTATAVTIAAPQLKAPVGGVQLDTLRPTLEATNAVTTGSAGTVTYHFEASELSTFPAGSQTFVADGVAQGSGSTKVDVGPSDLVPNLMYSWRVRATNGTVTSDWSKVETFITKNQGIKSGQTVFDPLTNGSTVGTQLGGHFVMGQGWQADSLSDAIDYDIPTCSSCRVEFDVTNFGNGLGNPADLKWISMGDASSFGDFGSFRDGVWKMHLEERGDGDGTGMKIIWRNGGNGTGDPGDHTQRNDHTVNWQSNQVFHFTFDWNPGGFSIAVNGQVWFTDTFGGGPYAPPNHRIELGCRPRGETQIGAIWSNVKVTPH